MSLGFGSTFAVPKAEAAFPGRNGRIAFAVVNEPAVPFVLWNSDLFTVSSTGGGVQQLSSGPEMDLWPAWSPDGRRIAFMRALHVQAPSDIYAMNVGGTELEQLTAAATAESRWRSEIK